MRLKFSLILALLLSILVPLIFGFYFLVSYVSEQHKNRVEESLEAITQLAKLRILSSVDRMEETSALISSRTQLRKSLAAFERGSELKRSPEQLATDLALINKIILDASLSISNIVEISLFDQTGKPVASTLKTLPEKINIQQKLSSKVNLAQHQGQTIMSASDPLMLEDKFIGLIRVVVKPSFIQEIVEEGRGLGETGEWVVAIKNDEGNALFVSRTRFNNQGAFNRIIGSDKLDIPVVQALAGNDIVMWNGIDYAGNEVVAATRFIPEYEWGIVAKINRDEVFKDVDAVSFVFWMVLAAVALIAVIMGIACSHFIAKPIENLTNQVVSIRDHRGDYNHKELQVSTIWREVAVLTQRFNEMINDIRNLNSDLNQKVSERTHELALANDKLTIEKQKAESATVAKSLFLANMSHELRTPLNSIYGSLQLLAREEIPHKSKDLVTTASYSMESLLGIINNILDFSKIEDNAVELESSYFSFTHIAKQVQAEMQVFADRQGLNLNYAISPDYEEGWLGDALRIKQVLVNFVSNAIKFTESGSVTIEFDSIQEAGKHYLVFAVKDTGVGMSEEVIEKLFHRFSQADSSTTRRFGGTGLGMPISLGLVKLMHGEISVDSNLHEGTTVTTKVPLVKANPQDSRLTTMAAIATPNLAGKTILLAEDNEINQVIFGAMLEDTGANIVMVSDGNKAVAEFKTVKPDIVFLDIQMPIMDGIEACKVIRGLSQTIPLVSITANISKEDTLEYEAVGFNHHIGKPVDLKKLYSILSAYAKPDVDNPQSSRFV